MLKKLVVIFLFLAFPGYLLAQANNYWSYNFNEGSSLVAGAVVGGGAGPSAIFYNPAIISEISASKLSLNASLFSYEIFNAKNALGEGIDLPSTRFYAIPRSVSYMHKPANRPNWSLEFAYLNVANSQLDGVNYTNNEIDILTYLPGKENYVAYTEIQSEARNDYFGVGGSYKLTNNFYLGLSMFVSIDSKYSNYQIDINASPKQEVFESNGDEIPYFIATHTTREMLKFNDYRLLLKLGLLYKWPQLSIGLNITTPSVGGIYSDGKKVMRKQGQSNITNPETGQPMQNFMIIDYAEKKDVTVNAKSPFSIAVGGTFLTPDRKRVLYATVEYFSSVESYKMVKANAVSGLGSGSILNNIDFSEWLTFVDGANPVFNAALGYSWNLKKDLTMLTGFKTDFNYRLSKDRKPLETDKFIKGIDLNYYHFTGGLTLNIKGQEITAGLQYSLGYSKNSKQMINLSDPVEFNFVELKALQGTRTNTVKSASNVITLLLAASFNFNNTNKVNE